MTPYTVTCVFCEDTQKYLTRDQAVNVGWRSLRKKWICKHCLNVIYANIQLEKLPESDRWREHAWNAYRE